MKKYVYGGFALAMVLFTTTLMSAQVARDVELVPNGKGWGVAIDASNKPSTSAKPSGSNGIVYHGGPVMLSTVNVYYIWYGNWSGNSATTILTDFAQNLGSSPYENINTTYYNGSNQHVSGAIHYAGSTNDN